MKTNERKQRNAFFRRTHTHAQREPENITIDSLDIRYIFVTT